MERSLRPYSIYARPAKKKNTYCFYVRFSGEDGRYLTGVNSGQSSRAAATKLAKSKPEDRLLTRNLSWDDSLGEIC